MPPNRLARFESAVRVVLKYAQVFNHHDIQQLMQLISDDCIFETNEPQPDGTTYEGKKEISGFCQEIFKSYPHARLEVEDIYGFSSKAVLRWKYVWITSTGHKKYLRGVDLFQVKNKQICEKLTYVKS